MNDNRNKNSRRFVLLAALSFCIPLALLYCYSYYLKPISIFGFELKKIIQEQEIMPDVEVTPIIKSLPTPKKDSLTMVDTVSNQFTYDTLATKKTIVFPEVDQIASLQDSIAKSDLAKSNASGERVLIMGDSETGGLCYQLNDYCVENGHKLVASIIWNSATILNLAYSDTIAKTIIKYKPTYVFIVVGLNEMYAKDLDNRRKAAQILAKKISGIPYTWIGPANYREDYGINMVFKESAELGTFYLTKNLNLPKGQDKRHPSKDGYRIWMDSVASWIHSRAKYKISMAAPKRRSQPYKSRNILLNAAKYRGY